MCSKKPFEITQAGEPPTRESGRWCRWLRCSRRSCSSSVSSGSFFRFQANAKRAEGQSLRDWLRRSALKDRVGGAVEVWRPVSGGKGKPRLTERNLQPTGVPFSRLCRCILPSTSRPSRRRAFHPAWQAHPGASRPQQPRWSEGAQRWRRRSAGQYGPPWWGR